VGGRGASIAFVGFMGSGKSRVGAALAQRLRLPFVDTDELIVERHGPIDRIFAEQGEPAFRRVERDVAVQALADAVSTSTVLSLGGGAVTSVDVRNALGALPHVVWLTAPLDVLFARAAGSERPLARDRAVFERLLSERRPTYAAVATVRVANDGDRPVDDVVDEVVRRCSLLEARA